MRDPLHQPQPLPGAAQISRTPTAMPELAELPAPPADRRGFPWDEATTQPPPHAGEAEPSAEAWPRITVVTPAFNDAATLEEALRSVLLQRYPNLEFVVLDGDSTDESVEIIRRYEPWLCDWVSVPHRGEAHAINRGLHQASGEILTWLTARDRLEPGALYRVAELLRRKRAGPELVVAPYLLVGADGEALPQQQPQQRATAVGAPFAAGALFMRASLWQRVGPLAETLPLAYASEWLLRALNEATEVARQDQRDASTNAAEADAHTATSAAVLVRYRMVGAGRTCQDWWRIHLELARSYLGLAGQALVRRSHAEGRRDGARLWPALRKARRHTFEACLLANDEHYAHRERRNALLTAALTWLLAPTPWHPAATSRIRRAVARWGG